MRYLNVELAITKLEKIDIASCQHYLQQCQQQLKTLLIEKKSVEYLMQQHLAVVDELLRLAWKKQAIDSQHIFLIAVGGYGRGELHPYSDIDLLILSQHPLDDLQQHGIHQFVQFCWDIGLEIGHSVRTVTECLELARQDVSVFTNLIDANILEGNALLFQTFQQALADCWSKTAFYQAKINELQYRHDKYGDTFSNLEPNIKNGPDGLRDIQTVFWLSKKILPIESILQQDELADLLNAQKLLWNIRYTLHVFAERKEDRLLFDYQKKIAHFFGYDEKNSNVAVEHFMKHFFITMKQLREVLEFIFQFFSECLETDARTIADYQDELFSISAQHVLFILDEKKFQQSSDNLIKLFLLIAAQEKINRLSAQAIRMIRQSKNFTKINHQLFLQLLKQSGAVDRALMFMNRFGVLGHYIEPFQHIIGQMQYDLFHIYTVDQHSLFVVKQLCLFRQIDSQKKFPLCYELMIAIPKPELLFIAAIFHDIGKGQGRDHSELGAELVERFCQYLQLEKEDTLLIVWLVKNHLLMSHTAQKKDIFDQEVIKAFAKQVATLERLHYLYLLTVSDICSTNPKLWNSWKDTLLQELLRATQAVLTKQKTKQSVIQEKKQQVLQQLISEYSQQSIKCVWKLFDKDYFLRETLDNIAWQTKNLLQLQHDNIIPSISIRVRPKQGALEIFIVSYYHAHLFAITTTVLSNLSFNIAEANIRMTKEGLCLSSYIVLMSEKNNDVQDINFEQLKNVLIKYYQTPEKLPSYRQRRIPRELKHFLCPTEVKFSIDKKNDRTVMELISLDRPGLLAEVSQVFVMHNIRLQMAKIMTMGEKVEDIFFMTDANNKALPDLTTQTAIKQSILTVLEKK